MSADYIENTVSEIDVATFVGCANQEESDSLENKKANVSALLSAHLREEEPQGYRSDLYGPLTKAIEFWQKAQEETDDLEEVPVVSIVEESVYFAYAKQALGLSLDIKFGPYGPRCKFVPVQNPDSDDDEAAEFVRAYTRLKFRAKELYRWS